MIDKYQVIVYHQDQSHNHFIVIMHKVFKCWKIVGKLFVKSVLSLIGIIICVGNYFVKYYKQIKVFYYHLKGVN